MSTKLNHQDREHAKYGASSMERIINCPPSVFLSEGLETETSKYAKEGTKFHELAELFLLAKLEQLPDPVINYETYNLEMEHHARNYTKYIHKTIEPHLKREHAWLVEARLIADEKRDIWGTADFIFIWKDSETSFKHAIIFDAKYGMGDEILAEDNWQLITYAYGALKQYGNIQTVEAFIYQPRIEQEETDEEELDDDTE